MEFLDNPLSHKTLWMLGLAGGGAAVALGLFALTRSSTATGGLAGAVAAIKALDPGTLCTQNGTVQAFQQAWNAAGNPTINVDGEYGPETATAAQSQDSSAPAACANFGG